MTTADVDQPRLPSLLIEAARSAAVADGLVPPSREVPRPPSIKKEQIKQNLTLTNGDGDAVAAALAMVASGNGVEKINQNSIVDQNNHKDGGLTNGLTSITPTSITPTSITPTSITPTSITPTTCQTTNALPVPSTQKRDNLRNDLSSAGSAAHRLAVAAATSQSIPMPQKPQVAPSSVPVVQRNGNSSSTTKKKGPPLRRGKWTGEEEAYANRLIIEFKAGLLPLTDGTTLRTFLSKLLNCDPMRISKKFVGSNCIGKQVFRRRTVDINRLTPEQIQQSRAELSELERRFLERVAQTNRVKSSGVGNNSGNGNNSSGAAASSLNKMKVEDDSRNRPPSPQWLRPPNGFKHGTGAAVANSSLSSGTINRAALAGRAMLQTAGNSSMRSALDQNKTSNPSMNSNGNAGLLALMEMQRRQSQNNLNLNSNLQSSSLADAAVAAGDSHNSNGNGKVSGSAMAQIARNVSAARLAGIAATGSSMTNLMLKTGLSRDQLSQLARDHQRNSSASLSNMMERQSSLDALMSLDFQSLQSIDNLANLIQTGGGGGSQIPRTGMKNWSSHGNTSTNNLANAMGSNNNLSCGRQLVGDNRVESLIRSLSSNNVIGNKMQGSGGSNATFNNLLQSVQSMNNADGNNAANIFGSAASALNLANMLRTDSSTGLTALRMQDGLAQRNSSVDDFLSLVASGDIPHQDPHMLNVPLQSVLQQQNQNNQSGAQAAATYLAQQQILAQAASSGDGSSLGQKIASLGGLANNSSAASLLSHYTASHSNNAAAAALAQQLNEARAATILAAANAQTQNDTSGQLKRKLPDENSAGFDDQGPAKR